ncbi:MAG: DUF1697 domain-containing protein [Verrucomicrobiota bacterium]|nr:DUF1697 domain-containing protein [Verrucomicrobiota bacterium]
MPRFVAFLRAINVGGHVVKMERLRKSFESLALSGVETFIASGNVVFTATARNEKTLRKKIEAQLKTDLGYEVPAFLRSETELARIAEQRVFPSAKIRDSSTLFIGFLGEKPKAANTKWLTDLRCKTDEFRLHGRELYWLCHVRFSDSAFTGAKLEKLLGQPMTVRNINTVRRLAQKLAAPNE